MSTQGYSTIFVQHHSETDIIKNTVMKLRKGLNGYLKPKTQLHTGPR